MANFSYLRGKSGVIQKLCSRFGMEVGFNDKRRAADLLDSIEDMANLFDDDVATLKEVVRLLEDNVETLKSASSWLLKQFPYVYGEIGGPHIPAEVFDWLHNNGFEDGQDWACWHDLIVFKDEDKATLFKLRFHNNA